MTLSEYNVLVRYPTPSSVGSVVRGTYLTLVGGTSAAYVVAELYAGLVLGGRRWLLQQTTDDLVLNLCVLYFACST